VTELDVNTNKNCISKMSSETLMVIFLNFLSQCNMQSVIFTVLTEMTVIKFHILLSTCVNNVCHPVLDLYISSSGKNAVSYSLFML